MKILERARELATLAEKATKGPWDTDLYLGGYTKLCKKRPNGDLEIADLFSTINGVHNARLASAAPEMAELLGKLAGKLEDLLPDLMGKCPPSRRYQDCPEDIDRCPDCWEEWLDEEDE